MRQAIDIAVSTLDISFSTNTESTFKIATTIFPGHQQLIGNLNLLY